MSETNRTFKIRRIDFYQKFKFHECPTTRDNMIQDK